MFFVRVFEPKRKEVIHREVKKIDFDQLDLDELKNYSADDIIESYLVHNKNLNLVFRKITLGNKLSNYDYELLKYHLKKFVYYVDWYIKNVEVKK